MGRELAVRWDRQGDRTGECRDDALRAINKLGPFAAQEVRAGALLYVGETLDWPEWLLDGTSFATDARLSPVITIADDLIATANLYDNLDPFEFAVRIMRLPLAGMSAMNAMSFQVAPTLGDALEARATIHSRAGPHIAVSFFSDAEEGGVRIHSDYLDGRLFRSCAVGFLGLFHQLAMAMVPRLHSHSRIEASLKGRHQALFAAEVDCPVSFGAAEDRLIIGRDLLDEPNPGFDGTLWELVLSKLAADPGRMIETPSRNVLARVRMHLDQHRVPRLKQIAEELGQSERTIVRLLNAEGTSYRLLVDAERRARAVELLASREVELSQVHSLLGFSDRPSFWRTFRRWFGVTPAQYRRD